MFRAVLNDKIGNILSYLAEKVAHLSLTKALKLLYIIDETAVRETGVQLTWLEYKVWKNGPVPDELFQELRHNKKISIDNRIISLDEYIAVEQRESIFPENQVETYLFPRKEFDFSILNDYEIELVERIIQQYGSFSARELVDILHRENTLWHKIVEENNLSVSFELYKATSNYTIDFTKLIENDEILKMAAQASYEALQFQESLLENSTLA